MPYFLRLASFGLCCFLSLLFVSPLQAQKDENWSALVDGSFLMGGNMTRNTLVYRTGPFLSASLVKKINPQLFVGGGFGCIGTQREDFLPVFLNLRLLMNANPKGYFFEARSGWSLGFNRAVSTIEGNSFRGGWFAQANFGYRIPFENTSYHFGLLMLSQQARQRISSGQISFREFVSFQMVGIFLGIEF